jgi:uncharacterized phage protein gp47/JayE
MPVAPSFDDLIQQFIAEAQAQRATLRFDDGNVTEAQAHGAGAMADVVLRYAAQAFRDTFVDGAKGDALTALVDDHYNIQRDPATSATVTVQLQRTSGGAGGTIDAGTTVATAQDADGNEVRFTTNVDQVVGAGANGPFSIAATCTVTGPSGNVAAGTITRVIDALFDTFTVTNPAAAGGGNDEESDDQLRTRARNFWTTLRRGTLAALEFGALQVTSVRIAKATEDQATGEVTLLVSDGDGNSTAQMISDVETEIENGRAAGCIVTVIGGTPLLVDVTGSLVVADGVDPTVLAPLVNAAIAARMKKLRQGEPLYLDSIKAAGIAVDPDGIEAINLTTPTGTVTPSPAQVIRPGTIAVGS